MFSDGMIPFLAFLPLAILVGYLDLRTLKITNVAVLAGVLLFILTLPAISMQEAMLRVGISAACFIICFIYFWLNLMGGGDTKFLPVALLFIPSSETSLFMFCFAFGLGLCVLTVAQARARWGRSMGGMASLQRPGVVPIGFALAIAVVTFAFALAAIS
jgi:prepilin peptidase CpaA